MDLPAGSFLGILVFSWTTSSLTLSCSCFVSIVAFATLGPTGTVFARVCLETFAGNLSVFLTGCLFTFLVTFVLILEALVGLSTFLSPGIVRSLGLVNLDCVLLATVGRPGLFSAALLAVACLVVSVVLAPEN